MIQPVMYGRLTKRFFMNIPDGLYLRAIQD